ncbi:MAG: protein kinase [Planctomycetaceae bacterium]
MSEAEQTEDPDEAQIADLIAEFHRLQDAGDVDSFEPILAQHPDLADDFREYLASTEQFSEFVRPSSDMSETSDVTQVDAIESHGVISGQFGRYRVLRELGRGGMGAVYLAQDEQLRRQVALKVPSIGNSPEPTLLERFYREARAAARLQHPGICPVYDFGEVDGQPFISMAYIEGHSLQDHLRDEAPVSPVDACRIVRNLADALEDAHAAGVIHRDLKPPNIMIDGRGNPIVMDFGLARHATEETSPLTKAGTLIGTPTYMAPEQLDQDSSNTGHLADVYSLGIIFYKMLTGVVPFRGRIMSVLNQIANKQPDPPESICPAIPKSVAELCSRMIAKRQPERPQSMAAVRDELDRWLAGNSSTHDDLERPSAMPRRLPIAVTGTIAVCVIGAWLWPSVRTDDESLQLPEKSVEVSRDETKSVAGSTVLTEPKSRAAGNSATHAPRSVGEQRDPRGEMLAAWFTESGGKISYYDDSGLWAMESDSPFDRNFTLTAMHFNESRPATDDDLRRIATAGVTELRDLQLHNAERVTADGLFALADGSSVITGLSIDGTLLGSNNSPEIVSFLKRLTSLKQLELVNCVHAEKLIQGFSSAMSPKFLRVRGGAIDKQWVEAVAAIGNVSSVTFVDTDVTIEQLEELKNRLPATSLATESGAIHAPAAMKDPARFAAEWVLGMSGELLVPNASYDAQQPDLSSQHVDLMLAPQDLPSSNFTILMAAIASPGITDGELVHLSDLTSLRHLRLRSAAVTGTGIRFLSRESIKVFELTDPPSSGGLTLAGAKEIAAMPNLQRLLLARQPVNVEIVEALRPLQRLTDLDLYGTPVSDDVVEALSAFPNLRRINLSQTEITKASFETLQTLPNLAELILSRFTTEEMTELSLKIPRCEIKFDDLQNRQVYIQNGVITER